MCRKQETGEACEDMDVMLAGMYILHEQGFLISAVQGVGFQGDYSADLWDLMKEEGEGFGSIIESNWMKIKLAGYPTKTQVLLQLNQG